MALHMMMARIRPLDPSSAPAVMSSLLSSAKPIATAESPAYPLRMAITVGMSAPPIGMIRRMPNASASTMMIGNSSAPRAAAGWLTMAAARIRAMTSSRKLMTFCSG